MQIAFLSFFFNLFYEFIHLEFVVHIGASYILDNLVMS